MLISTKSICGYLCGFSSNATELFRVKNFKLGRPTSRSLVSHSSNRRCKMLLLWYYNVFSMCDISFLAFG